MMIRFRVVGGVAVLLVAFSVAGCPGNNNNKKASLTALDLDSGVVDSGGAIPDNDASGPLDAGAPENDGGTTDNDAGTSSDASSPIALTSTLLTSGGTWPVAYACGGAAADVSPPLAWTGGPVAQSYAVVMVDAFFMPPNVHWLIYDMPAATSSLAQAIPAGYTVAAPSAHQSLGDFAGAQFLSPCPPIGGGPHTYEITVHALDVATLPGLSNASTATQSNAAVTAHSIATAKMSLTYSR